MSNFQASDMLVDELALEIARKFTNTAMAKIDLISFCGAALGGFAT